jgi:hypothetical protein
MALPFTHNEEEIGGEMHAGNRSRGVKTSSV